MPRPQRVDAWKRLQEAYNFQPHDDARDGFIPRKRSVKTPYMC